eukprot:6006425-Prymnesium_polylepis.1
MAPRAAAETASARRGGRAAMRASGQEDARLCSWPVAGRPTSVHSFAKSREIVLLGTLKPLFNVCA